MHIYLDNAATTPVCREAVEAMTQVLSQTFGNPSSLYEPGRRAAKCLAAARADVAAALGCPPHSIFFTGGGTEANNWAICCAALKMRHTGRHIISTQIEHDSVLNPLAFLKDRGWDVTLLPPEPSGTVSLNTLAKALRPDTAMVSIMLVNNETGAILPVREMAELVHSRSKALFHTDAIQGFLKIPFQADSMGADLLTVSAHKIHGPKGVGALYIKDGVKLPPLLRGGGQEGGMRSGTESLHNIAGFAKAAATADTPSQSRTLCRLQDSLRAALGERLPNARVLPMGAPHIVSLSLPGHRSEVLMNFLDAKGICVSHSSACKKGGRSHVLTAMGLSSDVIDGTIRVGLSRCTTQAELDALIFALLEAEKNLLPARR